MATLDVLKKAVLMGTYRLVRIALLTGLLLPATACATNGHWPPLTSQVVDVETGQPLEGAVVLAYWIRYTASLGGWGGGDFVDAEEVVTGPDGRYDIPTRFTYTIPGVTRVSGPELVIFKPGYGHWQRRPSGDTELMALPPLRTREERLKALVGATWSWSPVVKPEYTRRIDDALRAERAYLGLR